MGTFYAPNDYRNYIAHHGVKGMKWGVRKQRYGGGLGTMIAEHRINRYTRKADKHAKAAAELALQGKRTGNAHLSDAAQASKEASAYYRKKANGLQKRLREKQAARRGISDQIADRKYARYTRKADKHAKAAAELALQGKRTGNAHLSDAAQASKEASAYYRKKALNSEVRRLFKQNPSLKRDFGSPDMVDDHEYLSYIARTEYGMNTDALDRALSEGRRRR